MLRFYTKFVVQRCTVCCDRRHLDKSTSDYIRNTGTQGSCKRSCVLKSHLRFEIAAAIATQLRFQNVISPRTFRICRSHAHAPIPMQTNTLGTSRCTDWYIRHIQTSSPNPAVLATLGWPSLSAHTSKIKLVFLWRILCLPGNVYKDVVLTILNKCFQCKNDVDIGTGPIEDMYKAVCKYNMEDELIRCIQIGDYGNI